MTTASPPLQIHEHAPISTWFGIGGRADRLVKPASVDDLRAALAIDPNLLILGDGANLLVADEGVATLVASLQGDFQHVSVDPTTHIARLGAAAKLFRIIPEFARQGLAGLETLTGIPASVGGAVRMNAGGKFGSFADHVVRVQVMHRDASIRTLERRDIRFDYRTSGLHDQIILEAEIQLTPEDPAITRERFKECMAYKKSTQPMGEPSAGCVFKNPTLPHDLKDIAPAPPGTRVSAGLLIDRAGCKGMSVGGATVSHAHANFIITRKGNGGTVGTDGDQGAARANDVIALMDRVAARVLDTFGVTLQPEVVIWKR